jgi:(5-formylfuran-3-yl)methyl phosphate synthase
MTRLLASIRDVEEALIAEAGGADIIDLKEPVQGALGRLPDETIRSVLRALDGRRLASATIGDMPLDARAVPAAVRAMAETGVDIVKLGIFAGDIAAAFTALSRVALEGIRMVAVVFGDRKPDFSIVQRCADSGFYGVMLDTADKSAGPLTGHLDRKKLSEFIETARRRQLVVGLAGSLGIADLPVLMPLEPDYLGFRSALTGGGRSAPLDRDAVAALRAALMSSATAAAGAQSAAVAAERASTAAMRSSNPR